MEAVDELVDGFHQSFPVDDGAIRALTTKPARTAPRTFSSLAVAAVLDHASVLRLSSPASTLLMSILVLDSVIEYVQFERHSMTALTAKGLSTPMMTTKTIAFLFLCGLALHAQETYLMNASTWGPDQDAAVASAGGTVKFKHGPTGIAVVTSDSPNFVSRARATGVFQTVAPDMMVQWQKPVHSTQVIEAAVTPGDEAFVNAQWNLTAVKARDAWNAGFDGQGVRVAILD